MAVCLGLLASVPAFAQKITGDISGTVTDPSGAAVRAATVRAENTATGEKASATTSDTGFYRLVNLSPGQYKLAVEAQGFKTSERPAVVSIALTTQADFALQTAGRSAWRPPRSRAGAAGRCCANASEHVEFAAAADLSGRISGTSHEAGTKTSA